MTSFFVHKLHNSAAMKVYFRQKQTGFITCFFSTGTEAEFRLLPAPTVKESLYTNTEQRKEAAFYPDYKSYFFDCSAAPATYTQVQLICIKMC